MLRKKHRNSVSTIFTKPNVITNALAKGIREALIKHKKLGKPIVVWKDNKAVWIPPEKIVVKRVSSQRKK